MTTERRRWPARVAIALAALSLLGFAALRIAQHRSDGPLNGLLAGGSLRSGVLVPAPVDWREVLGERGGCAGGKCAEMAPIEFELSGPGTSRWVGIMQREGELFVPCDLGFMWGRFSGTQRHVLHLIYVFKHWHEDALSDGRAVLRIDGTRYAGQAERVTAPALVAALRAQLEEMGRQWVAPEPLAPPPSEGPRDIWFFRITGRAAD
jgi:hypothetical protein